MQSLKKVCCEKTPVLHFDRRVLLHRHALSLWVLIAPVPGKQDEILYGQNEIANGVPCDLVHTMYLAFFTFKISCYQIVHACYLLDCHKDSATFPGPNSQIPRRRSHFVQRVFPDRNFLSCWSSQ